MLQKNKLQYIIEHLFFPFPEIRCSKVSALPFRKLEHLRQKRHKFLASMASDWCQ